MTRRIYAATIIGGIAALAALQSCTARTETIDEIDQHAGGCGAFRYPGPASMDCHYKAKWTQVGTAYATGTCLNDSQVACTIMERSCAFTVDEAATVTECADKPTACFSIAPPEASIVDPNPLTVDLPPGSTLCDSDPPAAANQLAKFCEDNFYFGARIVQKYDAACEAQTDRNISGGTCCLPCPNPTPLPGGNALAAGELGGPTDIDETCAAVPLE
jgi:hypothetical protein